MAERAVILRWCPVHKNYYAGTDCTDCWHRRNPSVDAPDPALPPPADVALIPSRCDACNRSIDNGSYLCDTCAGTEDIWRRDQ